MRSLLVLSMAVAGCVPSFDETPWRVSAPRILAVRAEPPEARPGEPVVFEPLIASPSGTLAPGTASLAFCLTPRTLSERNAVSSACLSDADPDLRPVAPPPSPATIPSEACARFGPDAPPSAPGQPPSRPADADATGGYYVPVRAILSGVATTFGLERVRCSLPGAPAELVARYQEQYPANTNPAIDALTADPGGQDLTTLAPIAPGTSLHLTVHWPPGAAERYPLYDPTTVQLIPRTESLFVSWFATAGSFTTDRTGRTEAELESGAGESSNHWTAPSVPGPVWLWIVLRDSRGGTTWREIRLDVR